MNTISPKITIVTATLNNLPGLQLTAASIESQSFRGIEHVVVDGGSSDGTQEWLATKSGSILWISEPDLGIADAMNKGVSMASGEWVLVLHSEDTLVSHESLESAVRRLNTDADVVSYHVEFLKGNQSRIYKSRGFGWYINFKTTIPHQGALARRTLFGKVGAFDTGFTVGMDYDFFLRAHRHGARAVVVDDVLSRMPATGVSSSLQWGSLRARFREERTIQHKNSLGPLNRLMYSIYWPIYIGYRRMRHAALARSSDHVEESI